MIRLWKLVKDKIHLYRNSEVRGRWLRSYILLFGIPLLTYLILSLVLLRTIRKQAFQSNEQRLNATAAALQFQQQTVERVSTNIVSDDKLASILYTDMDTGNREYTLSEIRSYLADQVAGNELIEHIYVYLFDKNEIISDSTKSRLSYYYENNLSSLEMNQQEWIMELQTPHPKEYVVWSRSSGRPVMMLLISMPLFGDAPKATLCIQLDYRGFWKVAEENTSMMLEVKNRKGQALFSQGGMTDKKPTTLQYSVYDWSYDAYIRDEVIRQQSGYMAILSIGGIVLILLFGILTIPFLMKRNYDPLQKLLNKVEPLVQNKRGMTGEITYLDASINGLIQQIQEGQEVKRKYDQTMNQAYLICFLLGQYPKNVSASEEMIRLGFEENARYCVLITECRQDAALEEVAEYISVGTGEEDILFGYGAELNGRKVFVVDAETCDETSMKLIEAKFMEKYPEGVISWSSEYPGVQGLVSAFEEAAMILNSVDIHSKGVQRIDQLNSTGGLEIVFSQEIGRELAAAAQAKDSDRIHVLLDRLWEENTTNGAISLAKSRFLGASAYQQLIHGFKGYKTSYTREELIMFNRIQKLAQSDAEIRELLDEVISEGESKKSLGRDEQLVIQMQEYIDKHYTDALLNVESLCRVFNRAPSGVNKAFRDCTGHGPLTYINYRRIQEAKRIIVESKGSMMTSEVLQEVGFTNLNTFTRVFKKTEGITPGQFRSTVLQAHELA